MYVQKTFFFEDSTEYEYKFAGKYGAKGEKRQKKEKATPEQIRRQNQWNRQKTVFVLTALAVGILLEIYVNPVLMRAFLSTL